VDRSHEKRMWLGAVEANIEETIRTIEAVTSIKQSAALKRWRILFRGRQNTNLNEPLLTTRADENQRGHKFRISGIKVGVWKAQLDIPSGGRNNKALISLKLKLLSQAMLMDGRCAITYD